MAESREDRFRKYLIRDLICGVDLNESTHKLVFNHVSSVSSDRMQTYVYTGSRFGISDWEVRNIYQDIMDSFPVHASTETIYQRDTAQDSPGTIYYIETKDGDNLAVIELMKVSNGRMLVLMSEDRGLLAGDIISIDNSRIREKCTITAEVENAPDCRGLWYKSMPVTAIRKKVQSLVHEVYGSLEIYSNLTDTNDGSTDECLHVFNPIMGILMGSHLNECKRFLTVNPTDIHKGKTNYGEIYEEVSKGIWRKK